MKMNNKISFTVDKKDIPLNRFTQQIVRNIALGIFKSLKDVNEYSDMLVFYMKKNNQISVEADGVAVEVNEFVSKLCSNIFRAILVSLDGIPDKQDLVVIKIT
jgi:hypothetical protein